MEKESIHGSQIPILIGFGAKIRKGGTIYENADETLIELSFNTDHDVFICYPCLCFGSNAEVEWGLTPFLFCDTIDAEGVPCPLSGCESVTAGGAFIFLLSFCLSPESVGLFHAIMRKRVETPRRNRTEQIKFRAMSVEKNGSSKKMELHGTGNMGAYDH